MIISVGEAATVMPSFGTVRAADLGRWAAQNHDYESAYSYTKSALARYEWPIPS